jgi:hypothetical protein
LIMFRVGIILRAGWFCGSAQSGDQCHQVSDTK